MRRLPERSLRTAGEVVDHHNHHLSLSSSQPPPVTIIISNCGYTLMAILTTINFIVSLSGMKVSMGRLKVNTLWLAPLALGNRQQRQITSKVPLGKMGRGLANHIIRRTNGQPADDKPGRKWGGIFRQHGIS